MVRLRESCRQDLGTRKEPVIMIPPSHPIPSHPKPLTSLHSSGARDILKQYFNDIGGKPTDPKTTPAKPKRGKRKSTLATENTPSLDSSAAKSSKKRKLNGASTAAAAVAAVEKFPVGSWEDYVESVAISEAYTDDNPDGAPSLEAHLLWRNRGPSIHSIETVRQKCPQKVTTTPCPHPLPSC